MVSEEVARTAGLGKDAVQRKDRVLSDKTFSRRLMSQGYNGMLVRSVVKGAKPDDINIVPWNWGEALPSRLIPMDDDGRLSSPNS